MVTPLFGFCRLSPVEVEEFSQNLTDLRTEPESFHGDNFVRTLAGVSEINGKSIQHMQRWPEELKVRKARNQLVEQGGEVVRPAELDVTLLK
jgi:hypothetical protein